MQTLNTSELLRFITQFVVDCFYKFHPAYVFPNIVFRYFFELFFFIVNIKYSSVCLFFYKNCCNTLCVFFIIVLFFSGLRHYLRWYITANFNITIGIEFTLTWLIGGSLGNGKTCVTF